jgi:hypothetical protein
MTVISGGVLGAKLKSENPKKTYSLQFQRRTSIAAGNHGK